jgi:hypothetical protein
MPSWIQTPSGPPTFTPFLNRYTALPILLDVLHNRHITLLSPNTWEDRNDAYYLERYQVKGKLGSVLAICFSLEKETFHHWRIFSHGSSGVCIEFDKLKLLQHFVPQADFRHKQVEYHWISDLKKKKPDLKQWPFLKRKPFKDEREYRVIFESSTSSLRHKNVPIDVACVRHVTLSPWLPKTVASAVITVIKGMPGCSKLSVSPSTLIDNAEWRAAIT